MKIKLFGNFVSDDINENNIEKLDEAGFDWEDFTDTDLSGPGWQIRCKELIEEFKKDLDKELDPNAGGYVHSAARKGAFRALLELFKNEISEAIHEEK